MSKPTFDFKKLYENSMSARKNKEPDLTRLNNIADDGIKRFKDDISSDIAKNTVKDSYNIADLDNGEIDCPTLMSIVDRKLKENGIRNYRINQYLFGHKCIVAINT